VWVLTVLAACGDEPPVPLGSLLGGQSGEEGITCNEISSTEVGMTQATAAGFTAEQVLFVALGSHTPTLSWEDGSTTDLTLEVAYDGGDIVVREYDLEECAPTVELEIELVMVTADGQFDEAGTALLTGESQGFSSLSFKLDESELSGNYQVSSEVAEQAETLTIEVVGSFSDTSAGIVSVTAEYQDDTIEIFDIASWTEG
jgi:hypothetical protein